MSLSMVLASLYSRRDATNFGLKVFSQDQFQTVRSHQRRVGGFEVCLANQKAGIQRQSWDLCRSGPNRELESDSDMWKLKLVALRCSPLQKCLEPSRLRWRRMEGLTRS